MRLGMWTVDFNLELPPLASSDLVDVLPEVLHSTFLEGDLDVLVVLSLLSVRPSLFSSLLRGVEE